MKEGRNTQGQFTKGHSGFKPKGAVSKKKHKLEYLINLIFEQLSLTFAEDFQSLKPRQRMKVWMDLTKMIMPKLKRVPYIPDPAEESDNNVIFEGLSD